MTTFLLDIIFKTDYDINREETKTDGYSEHCQIIRPYNKVSHLIVPQLS